MRASRYRGHAGNHPAFRASENETVPFDTTSNAKFGLAPRAILLLGTWLAFALPAAAQPWAAKLFDHTSHDFGVVARGARAEHVFTLKNVYLEDVHIANVRSSCGCTSTRFPQAPIKTYQKGEIVATLDTRNFLGRKDATLTVVLDKPFPAEVQLHLYSFIRGDVVIQPGVVLFGSVTQGQKTRRKAVISYAGRDGWRIERVECSSSALEPELHEVSRRMGQASYDLSVLLKADAPVGYFKETLTLVTNDQDKRKSRIPVTVEGTVVPSVSVRPSPLMLGVVEPGKEVTKNLVVRADKPFRVVGMTCDDKRCRFTTPEKTASFHVIPVTFTASSGSAPGKINARIRIETDLAAHRQLEVSVHVQVASAAGN